MSYYPEPEGHIRAKFKLVLCYQKKLDHVTGVDAPYLADKNDFIAMKAEVHKLDINKLVNVPTSMNNLKTIVDDL